MRYINKQRFVKASKANSGQTAGTNGVDGQDGKSAYQIWLDLGNTGTEAEFINSLTGSQGIQGSAGNDGSDGIDGQDGQSAYEIWLDLGNTGTEQDFISSITGLQGVDGTNGIDGQDGKSAYEIWLDLGNTGTETDFINSLGTQNGTNGGDIQLTNRSPQILEPGDIVILDKNNPLSVTTTNLYYNEDVIGIVKTVGGIGQLVTIQTSGVAEIKMTVFPVNVGDNIYTGDVHGRGFASETTWSGPFAKALTSKPNSVLGKVQALLLIA